jgi:O-antigen/teichoic acid export membrane protein
MGTLYFQFDTVLINYFLGDKGVGLYQSAMRILMGGLVFSDILVNVYIPRLSRLSKAPDALITTGKALTRQLLLIGAAGSVVMFGFADQFVVVLYGDEYKDVVNLIMLFSVVLIARYFGASYGAMLTISDKQYVRAVGVVFAFVLNIGLNIWLIPRAGLEGAIYASIITILTLNLIYVYYNWMLLRTMMIDLRSLGLILITAASFLLFYFIDFGFTMKLIIAIFFLIVLISAGLDRIRWKMIVTRLKLLGDK